MGDIRRGEVYYINRNNAEIGSEQYSGRPAIIVSNDSNNICSSVYEIVYLTTQPKKPLPTHVTIGTDAGIPKESTALCEQITSVSEKRIGEFVCVLPDDVMEKVNSCLAISLGIKEAESMEQDMLSLSQHENMILRGMYKDLLDRIVK